MHVRFVFFLALLSVIIITLSGCEGDSVTNVENIYTHEGAQGIIGRVYPAQGGIEVAAWQATEISKTTTDSAGFFEILDLDPGLYDVHFVRQGDTLLTRWNVRIYSNEVTSFGIVELPGVHVVSRQYGYPLNQVPPQPEYDLIRYEYGVELDAASAVAAVSIEPPVELTVSVSTYDRRRLYVGVAETLRPNSSYTLTIDSTLAAYDGTTIGERETIVFQVQPLEVVRYGVSDGYYDVDTIADPGAFTGYRVYLNSQVDIDSFNVAATFDPTIPGIWLPGYGYYDDPFVMFFPSQPVSLVPEQIYTLTIASGIGLVKGVGFDQDVELRIRTRPVVIERIQPAPGEYNVYRWTNVRVSFNTPMDHAVTEAAFRMTTWEGTPVAGSFSWSGDDQFSFGVSGGWTEGQVYEVTIATSAVSQSGHNLSEEGYTIFRVRGY